MGGGFAKAWLHTTPWRGFIGCQQGLSVGGGGRAKVLTPIKKRPNWDNVKDILLNKKQFKKCN